MAKFPVISHKADICVIGGGLSGICAALAAVRHNSRVVLMHERPMLGGNASSEIRMWVCGARGRNNRETGIIEELMLENYYRNPYKNYSIWDGILWEKIAFNPNITLLLNCTCNDCTMSGNRISSVKGWQMTTEQFHCVEADIFIDCSGDSVLAPLSGAEYRTGREARSEFGESIAPEISDKKTMGLSCMIQACEDTTPSTFIPPQWAYKYTPQDLPYRTPDLSAPGDNFWYLELGGDMDSIGDSEKIRDELLKTAYGLWDFVKNYGGNREKNKYWKLDWIGFLPGKRESRRYAGDYTLTQNDISSAAVFYDIVAYGGWSMDDHNPAGFRTKEVPTIHHPAPSPYGIPYRCIYSKNIVNLMFAGRNISASHAAISSTRVMATCAILGQAAGTAASIAVSNDIMPGDILNGHIRELQQTLIYDDCYLPGIPGNIPGLTAEAALRGEECLRDGYDRPVRDVDHGCFVVPGNYVEYSFQDEKYISQVRIVFDSDLNRETLPPEERALDRNMIANRRLGWPASYVPKTMVKGYKLEGFRSDGTGEVIFETDCQYQRLCIHEVKKSFASIRLTPLSTWGNDEAHIFSFLIK